MNTSEAHRASSETYELAEGPTWQGGRVRWVDILAGTVIEAALCDDLSLNVLSTRRIDEMIGAALPADDGGLLVAGKTRLLHVQPDGETLFGPHTVPRGTRSRSNDAATDPSGRVLVGTLALTESQVPERLLRLNNDGTLSVIDDDLNLANGITWSPSADTLYYADTERSTVWARDYDLDSGAVGPRHRHLSIDGWPDGMCTDADGALWIAIWGASEVRRYLGSTVVTRVRTSAPHTSSVAFAGDERDTLVITTATQHLSSTARAQHPHSGAVFTAQVDARGLPEARACVPSAGFRTASESRGE